MASHVMPRLVVCPLPLPAKSGASCECVRTGAPDAELRGKAALLKRRVTELCADMGRESWWARVRAAQLLQTDHWEMQYAEQYGGRPFWINWVTGEKRWTKPTPEQMRREAEGRPLAADELAKDCVEDS